VLYLTGGWCTGIGCYQVHDPISIGPTSYTLKHCRHTYDIIKGACTLRNYCIECFITHDETRWCYWI